MQLNVRGIVKNHVLDCSPEEKLVQIKEKIASLENVPSELVCLYSCGAPLVDDQAVSCLENFSIDVTVPLLGGKVHGSLARAGKVKGQTPKVDKQEKKKKKTGRAKRRCQYNKRFVNTVQTFGRRRGPNANS